jgi:hypothetical protein
MRWRKASSRQVALSLRLPSSLQEPLADIEPVRGEAVQYSRSCRWETPMLEMLGDAAIGLVLLIVGVLLIIIGIPKHGQHPRFLRFEASLVLYPAVIMVFLAFGVGMLLRAYALR